jgi:hypothetical protein
MTDHPDFLKLGDEVREWRVTIAFSGTYADAKETLRAATSAPHAQAASLSMFGLVQQ